MNGSLDNTPKEIVSEELFEALLNTEFSDDEPETENTDEKNANDEEQFEGSDIENSDGADATSDDETDIEKDSRNLGFESERSEEEEETPEDREFIDNEDQNEAGPSHLALLRMQRENDENHITSRFLYFQKIIILQHSF